MSMIKRPATLEAYKDLIQQALYEVEELRASIEYDEEFMEDAAGLVQPLEDTLRKLMKSLEEGRYEFGGDDLDYMPIVNVAPNVILPFKVLLRQINDAHTRGLETGEED